MSLTDLVLSGQLGINENLIRNQHEQKKCIANLTKSVDYLIARVNALEVAAGKEKT